MKHESTATITAAGAAGNHAQHDSDGGGNAARSAVAREYHAFLSDVEHLISSATSMTAEELAHAKDRLAGYISSARSSVSKVGSAVADKARTSAKATDRYVRDQPWQAVGITAVAGLLIGFLLGRRRP
jgi:ElaB/YqjD/DUF883 family membrane-anchored ribosome-binding protein